MKTRRTFIPRAALCAALAFSVALTGCKPKSLVSTVQTGGAAEKVYVPPGKHDEFYNIVSGGFSGNVSVYGLPSGRLFRQIPVFAQFPECGWGYSEETKAMLNTSHGQLPWDDTHHITLSMTKGEHDGRWAFINSNNTPRVARISLKTFRTEEIIELPNCAGNHSSPFITENTEYIVAGGRFAVPLAAAVVAWFGSAAWLLPSLPSGWVDSVVVSLALRALVAMFAFWIASRFL